MEERLFLSQRLAYGFAKGFTAQISANDFAVRTDEDGEGNGLDTIFYGEFVAPALAVKKLRPRHAVLLFKK